MIAQFGKYLLLKRIALGGMAEIFLAKQTGLKGFEKLVVVKRILPQLSTEREFVQMFLDEARLAATLNHPNVVQIYDLGHVQDSYFIAMEFIAGHDLLNIIRKCKQAHRELPFPIAAKAIAGACEGLHYAHTRKDLRGQPLNIVHRDVSPSNILVSYEGGVKVVDFGIAKAESQSAKTEAGKLKGKFAYMSPEQIRGETLDGRSDVFGLGIAMHEALVCRRLFRRESELAIIRDILEGEVKPPSELREGVPKALDQICLKALSKDLRKRYQSAQEMQLDLERYLSSAGEPTSTVHVADFIQDLFAEESAAYQKLLAELPTAAPEELAEMFAVPEQGPGSGASGLSDPSVPNVGTGTGSSMDAVSSVRTPSRSRAVVKATLLAAGVAALAAGASYLLQPPPLTEGEVSVATDPAGAHVLLDGKATGVRTPGTVTSVPLGNDHRIRFELEGYEPHQATVHLTQEVPRSALQVTLQPASVPPGNLEIVTEPAGASVTLDGLPQKERTPLVVRALAANQEHFLAVSLDGYFDETSRVRVEPEKTGSLKLVLKPREKIRGGGGGTGGPTPPRRWGTVVLATSPPTEVLSGDGKSLGRTPLTAKLPAGSHKLTFVDGELDIRYSTSVDVNADGKTERTIAIRKGKLMVDATPWADVWLGQKKLGVTPMRKELYEGTYELQLVNSEINEMRKVRVNIDAGKQSTLRVDLTAREGR